MTRPDPTIDALPAQVLRTYKQLIQYIHSHQLTVGDRLPTQEELRQLLGKNHYTLSTAMRALANQGVLARKTGVGTVLCDLDAIGTIPWSIGMATIEARVEGELSVFANLAIRVQTRLNKAGCRCLSYSRPANGGPTKLHRFGLLANDLREGMMDGLVLLTPLDNDEWQQLNSQGIPLLHLPFWEDAPCGVIIDQATFARQALLKLAKTGCRNFGVVSVAIPGKSPKPRYLQGVKQGLAELGLPQDAATWINGRFGQAAGVRVAKELLERAPEERPDGLIVLDDYTARALTTTLSQGGDYRPQIAVHENLQLPLSYELPVHRFALDLEELVDRTLSLLFAKLYSPNRPNEQVMLAGRYQGAADQPPTSPQERHQ